MLKRLSAFVVFALITASCSSTSKNIKGPDGSEHKLVSCNAVEDCYEDARKACGGNYKIVNTSNESLGATDAKTMEVKLLVKCDK